MRQVVGIPEMQGFEMNRITLTASLTPDANGVRNVMYIDLVELNPAANLEIADSLGWCVRGAAPLNCYGAYADAYSLRSGTELRIVPLALSRTPRHTHTHARARAHTHTHTHADVDI